jgi:hypothetical protein
LAVGNAEEDKNRWKGEAYYATNPKKCCEKITGHGYESWTFVHVFPKVIWPRTNIRIIRKGIPKVSAPSMAKRGWYLTQAAEVKQSVTTIPETNEYPK